jgi:hypothetical protein
MTSPVPFNSIAVSQKPIRIVEQINVIGIQRLCLCFDFSRQDYRICRIGVFVPLHGHVNAEGRTTAETAVSSASAPGSPIVSRAAGGRSLRGQWVKGHGFSNPWAATRGGDAASTLGAEAGRVRSLAIPGWRPCHAAGTPRPLRCAKSMIGLIGLIRLIYPLAASLRQSFATKPTLDLGLWTS